MLRIARVRIRWIKPDPRDPDGMPEPGKGVQPSSLRPPRSLNPANWHVRVKWVGFQPVEDRLLKPPTVSQVVKPPSSSTPVRLLRTFDLPHMTVRLSWMGFGSMTHINLWTLSLLVACVWLGLFALTRSINVQTAGRAADVEHIDPTGLVVYEMPRDDHLLTMTHSPLDIGQSKDVFDGDMETLMRGRDANPFILDFEFSEEQAISGLAMDFGRMDFVMRVRVYGGGNMTPVVYEGEYREQPSIPHVEMDFDNGPEQVRRIYIEIEQLDPPAEVHVHIREVVFKE